MKGPLYEQLYNYLLEEIKSGRLKSGDRVPSEKELADQFKVSRITSKKALEKMVQARLVERARGKGSFVAKSLPKNLNESLPIIAGNTLVLEDKDTPEDRVIGLIMPDFSDAYGLKIFHAIEERCSELNWHLLVKRTYGRQQEEERAVRSMLQFGVDGLIVFPVHGEFYNADLLRLVLDGFPLVLIDRYLKGIPAPAVYTDNRAAAQKITEYLLDLGHQNIAFVSPPVENTSTIEDRLQGFLNAFSGHGLSFNANYQISTMFSTLPKSFESSNVQLDESKLANFIQTYPEITAFVACEYNLARILRQVLNDLQKKIPEDYSVVCFDSPEDPFGMPQFTHIRQDETAMGGAAVAVLAAHFEGEKPALHRVIPFYLVNGESVAKYLEKVY